MGWRLKVLFSDGTEELVDEVFENEEEAENEAAEWGEGWAAGAEVLELADEDYLDADIVDYEIWEE
ncbi:MAG: hypothetical protein J6U10_04810 [Lachnospiraceae bacterium]|nr:hypothetical protein [Lachnospiraceae bacterium]